jgi:hypothetical protein
MSETTTTPAEPETLAMIEKRRIEAEILKHVYDTLVGSAGEAVAQATIAEAVRRSAIEQAQRFAAAAGGQTSLQSFIDRQSLWTKGGALEIEVRERTETTYAFDVVRCRYAEMYRAMGLGHIGHLLSCNRDFVFSEGYDPNLRLDRPQTIMQGGKCCNFRYRYVAPDGTAG